MTNAVVDQPPQQPAAGAWDSLFAVQKPLKAQNAGAAKKKPAYGVKRNVEMCTEALGCETGGVDTTAHDADEGAASKRRDWEDEEEEKTKVEPRVRMLPPPLTTRMRMVHERRDGRLEVYAVWASGMEAERSGGRLRLRFLPCSGCKCNAAVCSQQEPQEAEQEVSEEVDEPQQEPEEEAYANTNYVRGGRCLESEGVATAARCGENWEPEQAASFWVAIT